MFSVYGKAGRIFNGSLEELRKIGPNSALAKARRVNFIGSDGVDQNPLPPAEVQPDTVHVAHIPPDTVHRNAVAAYVEAGRSEAQRQPLSRVSAIMNHSVVTVVDTATVGQAWQVLAQNGVGQAPVVGADGVLVGLLSRADLMRADRLPGPDSHALVWKALLAQGVADIMWTPVPSVGPETEIRRVARVLLDTGLPGLAVINEGGLVIGFVSRSDILRAVVADPPLDLWT